MKNTVSVQVVTAVKIKGRTYCTAKHAAIAFAQAVSSKINLQRYRANRSQPRDGYALALTINGFEVVSSQFPVYDAAYRRSLKIFQKILP